MTEVLVTLEQAAAILHEETGRMFEHVEDVEISEPFLIDNRVLVRVQDGDTLVEVATAAREATRMVETKFRERAGRLARQALETVMRGRA